MILNQQYKDSSERNEAAKTYVESKLEIANKSSESDFSHLHNYPHLKQILHDLIFVQSKGFRGVVATAITGKYLNPEYDPLNHFYDCKPRSIFENGIFYAFEDKIPCGKSDPLNVAKNVNVLDESWAEGKRPQKAAMAAVNYLRFIESSSSTEEKEILINLFFFKLTEYANSIASIKIDVPTSSEASNQEIGCKLVQFILTYPESGTTPQLVISKLLNKLYKNSKVIVEGGDESVFGTNTTSKKPADIWLELDGVPFNLFEITVKKVDKKRLDDCIQSLHSVSMLDKQVNFICRIPEDVTTLIGLQDGTFNYKNKSFNFINIETFITSIISLLPSLEVDHLLKELSDFMSDVGRPESTKSGWNSIFGNQP